MGWTPTVVTGDRRGRERMLVRREGGGTAGRGRGRLGRGGQRPCLGRVEGRMWQPLEERGTWRQS